MTSGDRDLAATHALGALPLEDNLAVEEELAGNAALATEVEEYRSVVETMEGGLAREAPPAGLFDVVLSRIEEERAVVRPAEAAAPFDAPAAMSRPAEQPSARRW